MVELQTRIKAIKEDLKETDDVYEFLKNSTSNTLGTRSKIFLEWLMGRGDSMIFTFHVPPLASGQGLCNIDRLKSTF